ncbi:hypothetical protein PDE_06376 [Penicillium oxalicum 114-2]|uniref:Transmembrane protein n=1 Tax=Penicillium oxalicum (strain 114-2 / CGMCC 5302) TaxID=933388 RepID=S7ZRV8_PENO1|nr:hypothetical protein PDE_06376 [Penicillium oxalicum 114-2]
MRNDSSRCNTHLTHAFLFLTIALQDIPVVYVFLFPSPLSLSHAFRQCTLSSNDPFCPHPTLPVPDIRDCKLPSLSSNVALISPSPPPPPTFHLVFRLPHSWWILLENEGRGSVGINSALPRAFRLSHFSFVHLHKCHHGFCSPSRAFFSFLCFLPSCSVSIAFALFSSVYLVDLFGLFSCSWCLVRGLLRIELFACFLSILHPVELTWRRKGGCKFRASAIGGLGVVLWLFSPSPLSFFLLDFSLLMGVHLSIGLCWSFSHSSQFDLGSVTNIHFGRHHASSAAF